MPIAITAYDTTALRGTNILPVRKAIEAVMLANTIVPESDNERVVLVKPTTRLASQIPEFKHPITFSYRNMTHVAVDKRWFMSTAQTNSLRAEAAIRYPSQYLLAKFRAFFNEVWVNADPKSLRTFSHAPMYAFVRWMETINNRLRMDHDLVEKMCVLAAYFYYCQFTDKDTLDKVEYSEMVGMVFKSTRSTVDQINLLLADRPVIKDLADFCNHVKETLPSVRTKELNPGLIISLTAYGWYGLNSNEIVPSALEHPPTWLALLLTLLMTGNQYRKTALFQVAEMATGKDRDLKHKLARIGGISIG